MTQLSSIRPFHTKANQLAHTLPLYPQPGPESSICELSRMAGWEYWLCYIVDTGTPMNSGIMGSDALPSLLPVSSACILAPA